MLTRIRKWSDRVLADGFSIYEERARWCMASKPSTRKILRSPAKSPKSGLWVIAKSAKVWRIRFIRSFRLALHYQLVLDFMTLLVYFHLFLVFLTSFCFHHLIDTSFILNFPEPPHKKVLKWCEQYPSMIIALNQLARLDTVSTTVREEK